MKTKIFLLIILTITLVGCFPTQSMDNETAAGFFRGIWHGWIAPISLILGLFDNNIRIYEVNNTGWWYDFGFYMAIISGFGGLALRRKRKE